MNSTSSIPPISSLQRYLTEARDSLLRQLDSEEDNDIDISVQQHENNVRSDSLTHLVENQR